MEILQRAISALTGLRPGARVVVAMSGGVDSSVCAGICQAAGLETVGVTLQLYDHGAAVNRKGACCAGADIHDARNVAAKLGIAHYVLDYESRFREAVIDHFADSYLAGITPVPCVRCNQTVKFQDLLQTARDLGAEAMITGHYVRRLDGKGGVEMHAGADPRKDQSYFLFATTQAQLDYLRFPLGGLEGKDQTRELAAYFGLQVADKPDSQDICFVPDGRYHEVIARLRPGAAEPGDIVDLEGHVLGQHAGILHYTIGQRRGIGLGGAEALYVLRLDAEARQVVVGPRSALARDRVVAAEFNWLDQTPLGQAGRPVMARIRSTQPARPARAFDLGDGRVAVDLETAEEGVSAGQALVLYDDGRLLGGGWIEASPLAAGSS